MDYKKIGVENFRVFKHYTEFEIHPITLLTGPNNSGKSSFTKLLLLLKTTMNHLDFNKGKHNLVDFNNILNWEVDEEDLLIKLGNTIPFLDDSFSTEIIYRDAIIDTITIQSDDIEFFHVKFEEIYHDNIPSKDNIQKVYLNIDFLIELIYSKALQVNYYQNIKDESSSISDTIYIYNLVEVFESLDQAVIRAGEYQLEDNAKFHNESLHQVSIENLRETIKKKVINPNDDGSSLLYRNNALSAFIDTLQQDGLLYSIEFEGRNLTKEDPVYIRALQTNVFAELNFDFNIGNFLDYTNRTAVIKDLTKQINFKAKQEIFKSIGAKFGIQKDKIEIKETGLGKLIFKDKLFDDDVEKGVYFRNTLFEEIGKISLSLDEYLGQVQYISPTRGSHKRVLMNQSETEIDSIVLDYYNLRNKHLPYLSEIFKILDIDGELSVDRHENYVSVVSLQTKDRKIPLHSLGYGYSQIIPIILKIIIIGNSNSRKQNLIIEEPEANLHPNLQSRLADIFKTTLNHFSTLNFIIETHSEYLIRKLQFLTAKNNLAPEQTVIYYFNADKFVSNEEPKVKKIEITPTGNLTDTFGPGFFDEITNLKFELMKVNKGKKK